MNNFIRYCPICNKEIFYKSKFGYEDAIRRNSKCLPCAHGSDIYLYLSGLIRNCPTCNKEILYKSEKLCAKANKNKSKCKTCSKIKKINIPIRICRRCGKIILYKTIKGYKRAEIKNSKCLSCSKQEDDINQIHKRNCPNCGRDIIYKTKKSLKVANKTNRDCASCLQKGKNNSFFGKTHTDKVREKLSKTSSERLCTDETRKKLRLHHIKQTEERYGQIFPNYNPKACQCFNNLMEKTKCHIQHAENGGEFYISELGYWVDGYDEKNNIVYEYDEKRHFDVYGNLKPKDIKRQDEIVNFLQCKVTRIKETIDQNQ